MALVCEGCREDVTALARIDGFCLCAGCLVKTVQQERELHRAEMRALGNQLVALRADLEPIKARAFELLEAFGELERLCEQFGYESTEPGLQRLIDWIRKRVRSGT